mgnify:CR=1 FL=1
MEYGMDAPIHVVRDGDTLYVQRGRGRLVDGMEAMRRLKEKRKPAPIFKYILLNNVDDRTAQELIDIENFHRKIPGPVDYALKVAEYRRKSYPDDRICFLLKLGDRRGKPFTGARAKAACDEYAALVGLAPAVLEALSDRTITKTVALSLAKLSREEQLARLERMTADGTTRGKAASDIASGKDPSAPRPKTLPAPVLVGLRDGLAKIEEAETFPVRLARAIFAWQLGNDADLVEENPQLLRLLNDLKKPPTASK